MIKMLNGDKFSFLLGDMLILHVYILNVFGSYGMQACQFVFSLFRYIYLLRDNFSQKIIVLFMQRKQRH